METITHAIYSEPIEGIATNMYSRALPSFYSDASIIRKEQIPSLPAADLLAAAPQTMALANHVLDQTFLILPEFLPLVHSIDLLVHYAAESAGPGQIMILYGQPGSGRKTAVKHAISHYPKIIIHSSYEGSFCPCLQMPIVSISTGLEHTQKGLKQQITDRISDDLQPFTATFPLLSASGHTADALLKALHTSLLVVNLRYLGNTASQIRSMTDYLSDLSRQGISILLIADPEQKMLLASNIRDAMDLQSKPPLELKPLSDGKFYDRLIAKLWKCLVVPGPALTANISGQILQLCHGNIALIVRSLKEAQLRALTLSSKTFSEEDLMVAIANCTSDMEKLSGKES